MERTINNVGSADRADGTQNISGASVQQALSAVFQSTPFRSSKQSQHLLQYIVDQTLAGHGESLKERIIGVNVFGRRPDYDTNEDPIVRARAAEVRKRLAQFYLGEGSHSPIRIEINPGSYHASFTEVPKRSSSDPVFIEESVSAMTASPVHVPDIEDRASSRTIRKKTFAARILLVGFMLFCLTIGYRFLFRPTAPIEMFWNPFVTASGPVLLYSGANAVYMLSNDFMNRYKATHHLDSLESQGREFVVPVSSDLKLEPTDLVPYKNDFITLGDLSANVRVASLLTTHRKQFDLRSGEDVAFSDLRQSPTVLIGAFNNSWTMELTGDLPFIFFEGLTIRDQANSSRIWTPVFAKDGKIAVDYAVVTRMPHSKTGKALIAIAGITQSGTHAAADFITDPDQIKSLVAGAPRDWSQKNLQFVLQTKVVNDIPTSPVVVAFKSW